MMQRLLIFLGVLIVLTVSYPAKAADYTIIQQNTCGTTQGSQTCSFASSVVAGDAIVCTSFGGGIQAWLPTCHDNLNAGSYTTAFTATANGSKSGGFIGFTTNSLGGSMTVTCTGNTSDFYTCSIFEVRGQHSFTNGLDQTNGPSCGSSCTGLNTISTGNITTTHASEIIFSIGFIANNVAGWGFSPSGWTQLTNLHDGTNTMVTAYQLVTSTGTYSNSLTASGSAANMSAAIASFVFGSALTTIRHRAEVY